MVDSPASFRAAIDAYAFEALDCTHAPARLLLAGTAHGLRDAREPSHLYALAVATRARVLAFEWSHDEIGPLVRDLVARGQLDEEMLWRLPPDAEPFNGDGRFTAGHVALAERLLAERRIEDVLCFDRLDPDPLPPPEARERDMAERLARESAGRPTLAVVGAAHLAGTPGTMRAFVEELVGPVAVTTLPYRDPPPHDAVVPRR